MTTLLNVHAPLCCMRISPRKPQIWFNTDIKRMKWQVRKKECLWRSQPTEHSWNIYKKTRRSYFNHIKAEKCKVLKNTILEAKGDSKKLFNLVKLLTGTQPDNPLPLGMDQTLADSFSDFFLEKIQWIQGQLQHFTLFQAVTHTGFPVLSQFRDTWRNHQMYYGLTSKIMWTGSHTCPSLQERVPIHHRVPDIFVQQIHDTRWVSWDLEMCSTQASHKGHKSSNCQCKL